MGRHDLRRAGAWALALLLCLPPLASCSRDTPAGSPATTASAATTAARQETPPGDLDGRVIALDPGHNGGNADDPQKATAMVPDGRGGTKACNTTGTATADGYTEHAFAWDVAQRLRGALEARGATVVMSRDSDDGVGPCVDERGTFAGDAGADMLLSIHANGSPDPAAEGFHLIVADPPLNAAQGEPSRALAGDLVDALQDHDRTINEAYGNSGVSERPDLAGLNHASVPAVIVETGEMNNSTEADYLASEEGRATLALALEEGVSTWLDRA